MCRVTAGVGFAKQIGLQEVQEGQQRACETCRGVAPTLGHHPSFFLTFFFVVAVDKII